MLSSGVQFGPKCHRMACLNELSCSRLRLRAVRVVPRRRLGASAAARTDLAGLYPSDSGWLDRPVSRTRRARSTAPLARWLRGVAHEAATTTLPAVLFATVHCR